MATTEDHVEDVFQRAAERMRKNTALALTNDQKLQLYGHFKQGKEGRCNTSKPGFFDFAGRAKWEAWNKLGGMSKEEAMEKYIELVGQFDPHWETEILDPSALPAKSKDGTTGGPVVSRIVAEEEESVPDDRKTMFDWCKEGNVDRLSAMVTNQNVNSKDEQGMALLHWACDRGYLEVVKLLVSKGADTNIQDTDYQTPLHYAASCDQCSVLSYLLSTGADTSLKDCDGCVAEEVTNDPSTRALFDQQQTPPQK